MSNNASPVVPRRRLRLLNLSQHRQTAGLSLRKQSRPRWTGRCQRSFGSKPGRSASNDDLTALLRLYHVDDAERTDELVALARLARQQSWWSKYRGSITPAYFQYLEYEADASIIRQYEALLIPGLLQTEQYATTAIRQYKGRHPGRSQQPPAPVTPRMIKTRVEIRMTRQQLLQRTDHPWLEFVLDEAVIEQPVTLRSVPSSSLDSSLWPIDRVLRFRSCLSVPVCMSERLRIIRFLNSLT